MSEQPNSESDSKDLYRVFFEYEDYRGHPQSSSVDVRGNSVDEAKDIARRRSSAPDEWDRIEVQQRTENTSAEEANERETT